MTLTIHVVCHAHLDPLWLWPWTSGLDEAVATARSACDRLDAHPGLFFTQGEAWTFALIERADPRLFARIRAHVAAGRWEVVNGWWTQPDCNLPTLDGLHAQIEAGMEYVRERFAVTPRYGFNPDSFGHCAAIPDLLRAHGQDGYVLMRPQEHELELPARVFRWCSSPGAEPITAFRVAKTYQVGQSGSWEEELRSAMTALPPGLRHTMVLAGVGNHGGGPTERMVRWIETHPEPLPGTRLEFSTVDRFFAAVRASGVELPLVTGELQHHAVGCYSVMRPVKTAVRRAEHALARAQAALGPEGRALLRPAWRAVCSHQFHDTLGGTCIPEAWRMVEDQLGGAAALANEELAFAVRRQVAELPPDELPRLILANPGADDFTGWCEGVPTPEGPWRGRWRIIDEEDREVPFQAIHPGIGVDAGAGYRCVLVHRAIPAGGLAVLRLDPSAAPAELEPLVRAEEDALCGTHGLRVGLGAGTTRMELPAGRCSIRLVLLEDGSDTWSHGVAAYAADAAGEAVWDPPRVLDQGPLMASLVQHGRIGGSRLGAEWRVYADSPVAELRLGVVWSERHRILKLEVAGPGAPVRLDGMPGMPAERANDGRERPVHDFTCTGGIGVVCPDIFALDGTPRAVRLTLLRSPLMAHHEPLPAGFPRAVSCDQGEHRFRFRFHLGDADPSRLAAEALAWHRPPLVAETTDGMPVRMQDTVVRAEAAVAGVA